MPETPRLRHGNRNRQNIYLLNDDGSETFVAVAMTPELAEMIVDRFNATTETEVDIRADERRKVAEEIVAALDEKALATMNEARNQVKAGAPSIADRTSRRSGAFSDAAEIARQIGDAREPR